MAFCDDIDVLTNLNMSSTDIPALLLTKAIVKADAEIRAAFSSDLLAALDVFGEKDESITTAEVDITEDKITVDIDIPTGSRIQFKTTDTLPDPLMADTIYYAIRLDSTHIKVAIRKADAMAGIQIDITDQGTGVHTIKRLFPAIIESLAEDIASYYVMRGLYSGKMPSTNEWIDRYKEAKETLKDIAEGRKQIEDITLKVGTVQSSTKNYKRTFDERDETNWKTDPDKLEDLADD
jgi:phage gp36-like protein